MPDEPAFQPLHTTKVPPRRQPGISFYGGTNRYSAGVAVDKVKKWVYRQIQQITFTTIYPELSMRHLIFTLLLFAAGTVAAQQFTPLSNSPLTTTPGDSRSVHIVDVNHDGWDDVYITNGLKDGQHNELYLNQGDGTFTAVANDPIVQDDSPSDGATFADADNDGNIDCFMVTWWGKPNFYYRNTGNGQFEHLPNAVTGTTGTYSETAAFGDYDNDGLVDLYITNSAVDLKNTLYRNTGNHQYTKIAAPWLNVAKPSRSANWSDYDNDGDLDLFVANEGNNTNHFFKNNGASGFVSVTGSPLVTGNQGTITASWGDVNNDGFNDLFIGNTGDFAPKNNRLYLNNGDGSFSDAPESPLSTDGGCSFGSAFADYDNDGDLDLFVANGYCSGTIENFLYRNTGSGIFERDLTALPDFTTPCSYGTAWGDLNNDGFQDLVVSTCKNSTSAPEPNNLVFINNGNNHHWLKLALTGTVSNRSAIGAKIGVTATINGQVVTQWREISGQTGYCGQNSLTAHVGLGTAPMVDSVVVIWPSGIQQGLANVAVDQTLPIVEAAASGVGPSKKKDSYFLNVAPNPIGETLRWTFGTPVTIREVCFELEDMYGRVINTQTVTDMEPGNYNYVVTTTKLTPGVYILRVRSAGTNKAVRVIRR